VSRLAESDPGAGEEPLVYVEVPDGEHMLRSAGVLDIIYEHCSYFTAPALRRLFADAGFGRVELGTSFGGQYLWIEARRGAPHDGDATPIADAQHERDRPEVVDSFGRRCRALLDAWAGHLGDWSGRGLDVVVWGAGSKGISLVNVVPGAEGVSRLVDLNPRKHGRYAPVTAHPVVPPEALVDDPPAVVLVTNPLYRAEVARHLARLGVEAEVACV
jgi:hypothetical protein